MHTPWPLEPCCHQRPLHSCIIFADIQSDLRHDTVVSLVRPPFSLVFVILYIPVATRAVLKSNQTAPLSHVQSDISTWHSRGAKTHSDYPSYNPAHPRSHSGCAPIQSDHPFSLVVRHTPMATLAVLSSSQTTTFSLVVPHTPKATRAVLTASQTTLITLCRTVPHKPVATRAVLTSSQTPPLSCKVQHIILVATRAVP